jgi:hypothetical protein
LTRARFVGAMESRDAIGELGRSPTIRGPSQRSDLQIKVRRRAAIERELSLAGLPTQFREREVKARKLYCALELVRVVTGEENQRHIGSDKVDRLYSSAIEEGLARKSMASR